MAHQAPAERQRDVANDLARGEVTPHF